MPSRFFTPILGGPLTELSPMVFLSQCSPGATVVVRCVNRPVTILKEAASSTSGWFSLLQSLQPGDRLVASQGTVSGITDSPETLESLAMVVGEAPTVLGAVDLLGRLWECGLHVWVSGAVPGAVAEIVWGGMVRGSAQSNGNTARFGLSAPLPANTKVTIRQRVGANIGPSLVRDVERVPLVNDKVPAPVILPVVDCQTAVLIDGVFEGTEVTLSNAGGAIATYPFDLSKLWAPVHALDPATDKWLTVRQEFPGCQRGGSDSTPVTQIASPSKPPTPVVGPLCAGATRVRIDNLTAGAMVTIHAGPDDYSCVYDPAGGNEFEVAPLTAGTVSVQQVLCGLSSDAASRTVDSQPASVPAPKVVAP